MPALGSAFRDELMQAIFNGYSITFPTSLYLALFLSDPTPDSTGIEVSGQPYQRQLISSFTLPSGGEVSNNSEIIFPIADEDWGSISHYGVFDNLTGGRLIVFGAFDVIKSIYRGDQYVVKVGGLRIRME